ncbi:MAG: hypothetical protein PHH26_00705 [Candidatus Thermoplasmatota archaeon]|nr:hypothetical protein [Candidatus Thermoplasmatota archaeon]
MAKRPPKAQPPPQAILNPEAQAAIKSIKSILTPEEMAEYQELEKMANQGRNQPDPNMMLKLSAYRKRLNKKSANADDENKS